MKSPLASISPPSRWCACLALVLLIVSGCARDRRFELLSIDPLESARIDAGRAMEITGSGFPVGREVEVSLAGIAHGPLGARRRVTHTLRGRTTSPERIELTASDADITALGGRGTFEGSLEVVVHGASLDGLEARVVGVLDDVAFDVVPSERRVASRPSAARDGLDLLALLGLSTEVEAPTTDEESLDDEDGEETVVVDDAAGVRVVAVSPDGAAARLGLDALGLVEGSRILTIDGMSVLDEDELRVDPRASQVTLSIVSAEGRAHAFSIDLDAAQGRRPDRTTRYDQLAIVVLVAALLFGVWPWSRNRALTPTPIGSDVDRKPIAAVLTASLALLLTLALSTLTPEAWLHGSIPLWLGAALFLRASAVLATRSDTDAPASGADHGTARFFTLARRYVRLESLFALTAALGTTVAVGVFVAARGTAESASLPVLGGPLASAPWMPMSWSLVRAPFGPFALAALLCAAASTSSRIASPRTRADRVLRGVDELGLATLASVFVRVAIADAASTDLASRATALVATVVLYVALLRARAMARVSWTTALLGGALASLSTIAVAGAWLSLGVEGPAHVAFAGEQAVAEVVLVCVGLLVIRVATLGLERGASAHVAA